MGKGVNRRATRAGAAIGLTLLGGLLWSGVAPEVGSQDRAELMETDGHLDRSAVREPTGLILRKLGWEYDCMSCHSSLKAKWHLNEQRMEHRELELKHGSNRFCLNCHHPTNRNVYADYDGSEIAQSDVVLLCGKCHGPQHRDWEKGVHGRRNGYWDTSLGESNRLVCIQCHDPHDPGFKAMEPLPGPAYPERASGRRSWEAHHSEEGTGHGK